MRYVDSSKGEVFSPIIYVFLREVLAAPVMSAIAHVSTGDPSCSLHMMRQPSASIAGSAVTDLSPSKWDSQPHQNVKSFMWCGV